MGAIAQKIGEAPQKLLRFELSPLPGVASAARQPYRLYANGAFKEEGIADEGGAISFEPLPGERTYRIETANGHAYEVEMVDRPDALQADDRLAQQGFRDYRAEMPSTSRVPPRTPTGATPRGPAPPTRMSPRHERPVQTADPQAVRATGRQRPADPRLVRQQGLLPTARGCAHQAADQWPGGLRRGACGDGSGPAQHRHHHLGLRPGHALQAPRRTANRRIAADEGPRRSAGAGAGLEQPARQAQGKHHPRGRRRRFRRHLGGLGRRQRQRGGQRGAATGAAAPA